MFLKKKKKLIMNSGQIFGRGIWVALKFCIDHDRVEFRI